MIKMSIVQTMIGREIPYKVFDLFGENSIYALYFG